MYENKQFDVLQTLEQGGACHPVLNHIEGRTLEEICRGETVSREEFYSFSRQMIAAVGNLHRCRPVRIYQFLTPYTVVVDPKGELSLLDTEHESNRGVVRKMFDQRIQESFFPAESIGARRPGVPHDLYTIGRTMQYMLAKTDASCEMGRLEEYRMRRLLARLTQTGRARRFASADEVKTALLCCQGKKRMGAARDVAEPAVVGVSAHAGRRRRLGAFGYRKYLATAAAIVVVVVGVQAVFSQAASSRTSIKEAAAAETEASVGEGTGGGAEAADTGDTQEAEQTDTDDAQSENAAEAPDTQETDLSGDAADTAASQGTDAANHQEAGEQTDGADGASDHLTAASGSAQDDTAAQGDVSAQGDTTAQNDASAQAEAYRTLVGFYAGNYRITSEEALAAAQTLAAAAAETAGEPEQTALWMDAIRAYEKLEKYDEALALIRERIQSADTWAAFDTDGQIKKELYERAADILERQGDADGAEQMRAVAEETQAGDAGE